MGETVSQMKEKARTCAKILLHHCKVCETRASPCQVYHDRVRRAGMITTPCDRPCVGVVGF